MLLRRLVSGALAAAILPVASGNPPSSLAPPTTQGTLRVVYTHAVVRQCRSDPEAKPPACQPRTESLADETSVTLVPLPQASLRGREDPRQSVSLVVSSKDGAAQVRKLGPGAWRVAWPAYTGSARFVIGGGETLEVRLQALDGRCDTAPDGCRLVLAPTRRSVEMKHLAPD